ncbi:protocatechuate 3,4-dioxygenase subunit beta [Aurantibacter crassamenti]|uniref:protocatechuate 3,4-dioxygenase subunit beta n=1 Tax=Aurantibacter crassamenti TaxID=1837375 RepID=UPI001939F4F2|nr:protocatechuate 3,4-dioxygenase subunit beta [Aurantibacter crassamenti]MBM1107326.1 protocatechuate 3,4-dioxygenase subunit beta [Aurantibacter crassamenti]
MSNIIQSGFDKEIQPSYLYEGYKSTIIRAPTKPLVMPKKSELSLTGPVFKDFKLGVLDHDLTKNAVKNGEPLGERIVVHGKVTNEKGHPIPYTLLEIWQANSSGRYIHKADQHDAPLDPNFSGAGRCMTDAEGNYKFYTIKPGAYSWGNHPNAWRPNHIHFSLFGGDITSRLITQMYFPGDPLLEFDPMVQSIPLKGRDLLISKFDLALTEPDFALGYRFDIVLRGHNATPFENL